MFVNGRGCARSVWHAAFADAFDELPANGRRVSRLCAQCRAGSTLP